MKAKKMNKLVLIILLLISLCNPLSAQTPSNNQVTSISWENNFLTINTTQKISYTEGRLKEPERVVIDLLNCMLAEALHSTSLQKRFKSEQGEVISITEPNINQIRIVFQGEASINRKSYLTNNERTLIIRVARIGTNLTEEKIIENEEKTNLEKYTAGNLKDITIEENKDVTKIIIQATRSIKYNSYHLKNPERFAVDLLNVIPPESPLPKYNATPLVSSVRIGQAASGIEATRIVIDLTREDLDVDLDSSILGNKLEIKFKINKKKEDIIRKSGIKVLIDPGHGGYDTGASYGGYEEKDITLLLSEKLKKRLEDFGITVFLTRDEDGFLSLAERVEITNAIKPHVFISIHVNALVTSRGIRGAETYYWTSQSQRLAYFIHKSILSHVKIPDHFIRKAKFYVIRHTSSPAILAELGFLSNREDRQLLTNATIQDEYTKALAEAILRFLDIEPSKERNGETAKGQNSENTEKKK